MREYPQYDTRGNLVAVLSRTDGGKWLLIPEPDYPFVVDVQTGKLLLWDRKNGRKVEFARDEENK